MQWNKTARNEPAVHRFGAKLNNVRTPDVDLVARSINVQISFAFLLIDVRDCSCETIKMAKINVLLDLG